MLEGREGGQSLVIGGPSLVISEGKACKSLVIPLFSQVGDSTVPSRRVLACLAKCDETAALLSLEIKTILAMITTWTLESEELARCIERFVVLQELVRPSRIPSLCTRSTRADRVVLLPPCSLYGAATLDPHHSGRAVA